jgi:uncharacterized protein (DUF2164 family)
VKKIAFEKRERDEIVDRIQRFMLQEHDLRLGGLEAEVLLDFFAEKIGPFYYNQGLNDAQAMFAKSIDDINERIYDLEQPVSRGR